MAVHTRDCTLVIVSMVLCLIHRMYALPDYLTVKPWNTVVKWRFLICNMWIYLKEYEGKLVIDWGGSASDVASKSYHRKAHRGN